MASTPSLSPSPELSQLVSSLQANRISLGCWMCLFLWDYVASLPQETRTVWKNKWTPLKTFYLLNRYTTLVGAMIYGVLILGKFPQGLCSKIYWLQPVLGTLTITLCAVIAAIRVHAIFNRDRRILFLLITSLFASLTVTIVMLTRTNPRVIPEVAQVRFAGCMTTQNNQRTIIISWIAPLCFDSLILFLTIFRSCSLRQKAGSTGGSPTGLRKIVNKHILYFAVITVVNGLNVGFYAFADPALKSINVPATIALTSIMSSRLVLSLYSQSTTSPTSSCASSQAGSSSRRPSSGVGSAFNSVQSSNLPRPTPSRTSSQESHHDDHHNIFSPRPEPPQMIEKPKGSHQRTPSSIVIPMSSSHPKEKPSSLYSSSSNSSNSSTSRRSYEHIIIPITLDPLHLHSAIPPSSSTLRPLLLSSSMKPPSLHSNHSSTSFPPVTNPQARPTPTRSHSLAKTMIPEIEPSTPLTFSASFFNSETSSLSSSQKEEEEEEELRESDIGEMDTEMRGKDGFSSSDSSSSSSEVEEGSESESERERERRRRSSSRSERERERESLRRVYL